MRTTTTTSVTISPFRRFAESVSKSAVMTEMIEIVEETEPYKDRLLVVRCVQK